MSFSSLEITVGKLFRFLYVALLFFTLLYLLLVPFVPAQTFLLRLPSLLIILSIAVVYVFYKKYNIWEVISFLGIISIILLNYLLYPETVTSDALYRTGGFIAFVILIVSSDALQMTEKTIKLTYFFCLLCAIIFLCYSFSSFAYWNTKQYVDSLTLGFYNPNFTAMVLFFLFSLLFICMPNKHKMLSILFELIILYLLFKTKSRTSFFSTILIPIFSICLQHKSLPKWLIIIIAAIPFLFVKIYLLLYHSMSDVGLFFGKTIFSGREITYVMFLNHIKTPLDYLIGHAQSNIFANAHNGPLGIFVSLGILGSICFWVIWFRKIFIYNSNISNKESYSSILVLLACLLNSCAEGGCLLGGFPLLIFVYIIFVLANNNYMLGKEKLKNEIYKKH